MPDVERMIRDWARQSPGIEAAILFGSHARGGADSHSDWDFYIIAKHAGFVAEKTWVCGLGLGTPSVYALRDGVIGAVTRVTAIWPGVVIDFVVLPSLRMRMARLAIAFGLHRRSRFLQRKLGEMALIVRPGYRLVHGEKRWGSLYRRVCEEVADPRLSRGEILSRAELFVADYVWVKHKIERGELLAAQRVLHRALAERNFELVVEARRRKGMEGWPEARRIEGWASAEEYSGVCIAARPTAPELSAALESCAATFRRLVTELEGSGWSWPEGLWHNRDEQSSSPR
jgi:hypothetical protein